MAGVTGDLELWKNRGRGADGSLPRDRRRPSATFSACSKFAAHQCSGDDGSTAPKPLLQTAWDFGLSRQGEMTDRYTKADEQLGSDKLDMRIGGVYAAESVRASKGDQPVVTDVLAAFARKLAHHDRRSRDE